MNKKLILLKSFLLSTLLIDHAFAKTDDVYMSPWRGFYTGLVAGYTFNDVQLDAQQLGFTSLDETCDGSLNFSTFFPGIELGYLYQFPYHIVTGIDANVTANAKQKNTFRCVSEFNADVYDRFTFKNFMQTSVKGRIGYSLNWHHYAFLPYLTGGASFANVKLSYHNEGGDQYSENTTPVGWLVGAGMEWEIMSHWSLRAEYYYANYNKIKLQIPSVYGLEDPNGHANVDLSTHNIFISMNYWF
jgi:outer membrane immunogenic protein